MLQSVDLIVRGGKDIKNQILDLVNETLLVVVL